MGKLPRGATNRLSRRADSACRYYDPSDETDPCVIEDRIRFLQALKTRDLDVLPYLYERVFPTYHAAWSATERDDLSIWDRIRTAAASCAEVAALSESLVGWAGKFHLTVRPVPSGSSGTSMEAHKLQAGQPQPAKWLLNVAVLSMKSWAEAGEESGVDWHYPTPGIAPKMNLPAPAPFSFAAWQPRLESRTAYRDGYILDCGEHLEEYLDMLERRASESGLERERLRRKPRRDRQSVIPESREFEWLALWQSAGLACQEIRKIYRYNCHESTIRKAVAAAARRVGITLRK